MMIKSDRKKIERGWIHKKNSILRIISNKKMKTKRILIKSNNEKIDGGWNWSLFFNFINYFK
jgi:hypothetical protein